LKEITFSEFKVNCSAILERVRKTRKRIRVTYREEPLVEIVPISPLTSKRRLLGSMRGTAQILGDIVGPTGSLDDWEAWRD
jgi:prevent-host-death family protein